jgi:hypothetical protein
MYILLVTIKIKFKSNVTTTPHLTSILVFEKKKKKKIKSDYTDGT